MENQIQARQVAYIVNIRDINNSKFVKEEGWNPNFVLIDGKKVSRVNIVGAVIGVIEENNVQTITLDDGTGRINIKNFETTTDVSVGDIILLIGRVRQYGNETYLAPEIIKRKINPKWSTFWKKSALKKTEDDNNSNNEEENSVEDERIEEEEIKETVSYREKVIQKIKDLDDGSGASYGELIKSFPDEKYISKMILEGDIFEIKPGKLKALD